MTAMDHQTELGARLRDIRQQQGLTLQQVEEASAGRWKAVVVGSYERGDRAISVARLAELAAFYRVPVSAFLPRVEGGASPAPATPRVVIDLVRLGIEPGDDVTPLTRLVGTIQRRRGDYNGRMLTLRRADLQAMSTMLGRSEEELVSALGSRGLLV